jgi:hypothetical protein
MLLLETLWLIIKFWEKPSDFRAVLQKLIDDMDDEQLAKMINKSLVQGAKLEVEPIDFAVMEGDLKKETELPVRLEQPTEDNVNGNCGCCGAYLAIDKLREYNLFVYCEFCLMKHEGLSFEDLRGKQ